MVQPHIWSSSDSAGDALVDLYSFKQHPGEAGHQGVVHENGKREANHLKEEVAFLTLHIASDCKLLLQHRPPACNTEVANTT